MSDSMNLHINVYLVCQGEICRRGHDQIKSKGKIIYIDPAYLRTYYAKYPKKIEFSKWLDTIDGLPEMTELGSVDVALLPIGGTFTMDLQEAVRAAKAINPKIVIPMHRNKANPLDFKKKIEATSNIKVVPLQIGEVFNLK